MKTGQFTSFSMRLTVALLIALFCLGAAAAFITLAQSHTLPLTTVPPMVNYQGYLEDTAGEPMSGTIQMTFKIFTMTGGGDAIWSEVNKPVLVTEGYFSTLLGSQTPLEPDIFDGSERYLEVQVADSLAFERQPLTSVPYALVATHAVTASTALYAASANTLQNFPLADISPDGGQVLVWGGEQWEPASFPAPNQSPVAVLQADPSVLYLGTVGTGTVALDMGLSYDPDSVTLTYAFDPAGRSLAMPAVDGITATHTAVYEERGEYLAAGWVRDAAGAYDRAQALISVHRFDNTIVDYGGDVGKYASLALVDGHPGIAYYDQGSNDLKYVRSGDAMGIAWHEPAKIAVEGDVGQYASLAVISGNPAIAYYDATNVQLKYVRAQDTAGMAWGTAPVTASSGISCEYISLAVVDGNPAIAYYDATNQGLKYVRATDANGETWGGPVSVDAFGDVGQYASLAVVNGNPAIAYYEAGSANLKYIRADDPTGASWGSSQLVSSEGDVGKYASLAIVDGNPAIAYYDDTNNALVYRRAVDVEGADWADGEFVTVDASGNAGWYASLAILDSYPAIAYLDTLAGVKFVYAKDSTGQSWGTPVLLGPGQHVSLAVVRDRPAIAYYNSVNNSLYVAMPR